KWADTPVMRVMFVLLSLPSMLLAVAVVAIIGPGRTNTRFAIAIVALPASVRLTRAAALGELQKEYGTASRVAGAGTPRR
ncbi:ABC transporter permease subunit, partial [Burkholderia pseudomallei]